MGMFLEWVRSIGFLTESQFPVCPKCGKAAPGGQCLMCGVSVNQPNPKSQAGVSPQKQGATVAGVGQTPMSPNAMSLGNRMMASKNNGQQLQQKVAGMNDADLWDMPKLAQALGGEQAVQSAMQSGLFRLRKHPTGKFQLIKNGGFGSGNDGNGGYVG